MGWMDISQTTSTIRAQNVIFLLTLNRASGSAVSPGIDSSDVDAIGVGLCGTPWCGVTINCGAAKVRDAHEMEGEDAGRSLCRARYGSAASNTCEKNKHCHNLLFSIHPRCRKLLQGKVSLLLSARVCLQLLDRGHKQGLTNVDLSTGRSSRARH